LSPGSALGRAYLSVAGRAHSSERPCTQYWSARRRIRGTVRWHRP
jgi:hypothetical protein